jgi:hypothetical protein
LALLGAHHVLADHGGGDIEPVGGGHEAAGLHNLQKYLDAGQPIHRRSLRHHFAPRNDTSMPRTFLTPWNTRKVRRLSRGSMLKLPGEQMIKVEAARFTLIAAVAAVLSACAVGPTFKPPVGPSPGLYLAPQESSRSQSRVGPGGKSAASAYAQHLEVGTSPYSLELARESYSAGNTGILQVLDAQRQRLGAQLGVLRAEAQQYSDTTQLFLALGGGASQEVL